MNEPIEAESRAVAVVENGTATLALITGSPSEVVARATEMADELRQVIRQQHLYAKIGNRDHVTVEGWTTLGAMVGVFPVIDWSRPTENGEGWEARCSVKTLAGATIGAAEAQCTRSENTWKSRDDYALRSMAQTRATSKAMRLPLAWVMALAGFDPTPAEEMPAEKRERPTAKSATPPEGRTLEDAPKLRYDLRKAVEAQRWPKADETAWWAEQVPEGISVITAERCQALLALLNPTLEASPEAEDGLGGP